MPNTYTDLLRLTKQADGDNLNTWGQILNNGVFELAEDAMAKLVTIDATALSTYALTTANGSADEARCLGFRFTGNPTASVTITIPVSSKMYLIRNDSTKSIIISTGDPTTRTIPAGMTDIVFTQGTAVYSLLAYAVLINAPIPVNQGGTGVTTFADLLVNLLPSQTGNAGKYLKTDGSVTSWGEIPPPFATGDLKCAAYATAPTGWLFAAGQAVSRTTYADLFLAISTTYGAGDGSTTFNVPDLRSRVVAGLDNLGGTAANRITNAGSGITATTMGATGGAEKITLTAAQSGGMDIVRALTNASNVSGPTTIPRDGSESSFVGVADPNGDGGGAAGYRFKMSGATDSHANVQPTIFLNWLIKT